MLWILRDSSRNTATLRPSTVLLFIVLVVAGGVAVAADSIATRQQLDEEAAFTRAGGYVYVVNGLVDGPSCRSLGSSAVVRRVGAARYLGPTELALLPGRDVPLIEVAGDAITIWSSSTFPRPQNAAGSLLLRDLSPRALTALTTVSGDSFTVEGGVRTERNPAGGRALMLTASWHGSFDECWVEFSPLPARLAASLMGAVDAGPEASLRVLAARSPGTEAPEVRFAMRPTQWAWLVGAAITTLVLAMTENARRSMNALYAILRWSTADIAVRRILEHLIILVPARLLLASTGVAFLGLIGGSSRFEASMVLSNAALTGAEVVGAIVIILATRPRDLLTTLRSV